MSDRGRSYTRMFRPGLQLRARQTRGMSHMRSGRAVRPRAQIVFLMLSTAVSLTCGCHAVLQSTSADARLIDGDGASGGAGGIRINMGGAGGNDGGDSGDRDSASPDLVIVYPPDGSCGDERVLWSAIASAAGAAIGYCAPPGDGGVEEGHVVVDGEGRIIDNSLFGCERDGSCDMNGLTDWLASLAAFRWPCLAGRTISYACVVM
jgi:hypothetical protein